MRLLRAGRCRRGDALESARRPTNGTRLPAPAAPPARFRFDDVLIDLDAREILRADARIEVEAKVFDLIALLLANRERAMDKRELNAILWGDRPVTDAALSQQLRKARRALGDDGNAQRVIRTVHGRGLRWVADVAAVGPDAPVTPPPAPPHANAPVAARARVRHAIALACIAALVLLGIGFAAWQARHDDPASGAVAAPRIAILPLDDQSAEPALAWTRRGLMGLMAGLFEQGGHVDVVPARSIDAVDAAARPLDPVSARSLRSALGATHLVATRLRRVGPLYEFELRLIAPGGVERNDTLHGDAPAALAVQAVQRVRRWLDLGEPTPAPGRVVSDPFLAEAHARGLDAQLQGDHAAARRYFEICLDQDPALAWPRLALSIAQGETGDFASSRANAALVEASARELGDDELLVAALRQQGSLAFRQGDLDSAAAHIASALEDLSAARPLALTDLLVAQASIDDERGRFDESRTGFARALALARETGNRRGEALVLVNIASLENGVGDAAGAARSLRAGLAAAREAGDGSLETMTLANLAATEANQGRLLDAVSLDRQALLNARRRGDVHSEALVSTQLIRLLALFGREADVATLALRAAELADGSGNPYWQAELQWALAGVAERRGDPAEALSRLERARGLYAGIGMTRSLAPVLASIVETAARAGERSTAQSAASAFRALAAADPHAWNEWLPLLDAQLQALEGNIAGAIAALADRLDRAPDARGAAAQATLFQLGRWQVASGAADDLLLREAWTPWLAEHPDAIALRISALRTAGRGQEAAAEQARLDRLRQAPQLDPSPQAAPPA